jgi:hypothetical protein
MTTRKRFKCQFCGHVLPAWLPVAKRPDGAILLYHLGQHHPNQVGPYLTRMETEDIAPVVVERFELAGSGARGCGEWTE